MTYEYEDDDDEDTQLEEGDLEAAMDEYQGQIEVNPGEGLDIDYDRLAARYTVPPRADVDEELDAEDTSPSGGNGGGGGGMPSGGRMGTGPSGVAESIESMADLSDIQTGLMMLFPPTLGDSTLNKLMVARTPPECELPLTRILTTNDVMCSDPETDIDVNGFLVKNSILVGIGRDGMGRIDQSEIIGASKEQSRLLDKMRGGYGE